MLKPLLIFFFVISLLNGLSSYCSSKATVTNMPESKLDQLVDNEVADKVAVGGTCPKEQCLYIFTAPWCHACRSLKKTIKDFIVNAEEQNMDAKWIVGESSLDKIKEYCAGLDLNFVVDPKGDYFEQVQVSFLPMYYLTDHGGKILRTGSIQEGIKVLGKAE